MAKNNSEHGFTLVEMLVVLAIFSTVVSLVMFGFEQGRSQWQRALNENNNIIRYHKQFSWLSSAFNQSVASNFSVGFSDSAPYFKGDSKKVSFLSESPILGGPGTYAWVEINQKLNDGGGLMLVYQETPNSDPYYGLYETNQTEALTLFTDVEEYHWRYYVDELAYNANGGRVRVGRHWVESIDSYNEAQMPVMAKLTVKLKNGQEYVWPFKVTQYTRSADIGARIEVK